MQLELYSEGIYCILFFLSIRSAYADRSTKLFFEFSGMFYAKTEILNHKSRPILIGGIESCLLRFVVLAMLVEDNCVF